MIRTIKIFFTSSILLILMNECVSVEEILSSGTNIQNLNNNLGDKTNTNVNNYNDDEGDERLENIFLGEGLENIADIERRLRDFFSNEQPYDSEDNSEDIRINRRRTIEHSSTTNRNVKFYAKTFVHYEQNPIFDSEIIEDPTAEILYENVEHYGDLTNEGFANEPLNQEDYDNGIGSYGYMNDWVVHLQGGPELAKMVIEDLGYRFLGPVPGFRELYRVNKENHPRIQKREATDITHHLNSHTQVIWAEQQQSKVRVKRHLHTSAPEVYQPLVHLRRNNEDVLNTLKEDEKEIKRASRRLRQDEEWPQLEDVLENRAELSDFFNDELVGRQWYLHDTRLLPGLPRLDLGVVRAWADGLTGEGVRVVILDDGLDYTHDDLKDNYDPSISYDFNSDDPDPLPRFLPEGLNSHGTKCAGEVAMVAANHKCGVGVAFRASIGGIRMLDGPVSDVIEGQALAYGLGLVDVVSCSWGPLDDGATVEGPGTLVREALKRGVQEGRGGKGTVFIWAAGNGGEFHDNCNCDGYTSSVYTATISSASQSNLFPWYGERCSSILATTYSSGAYSDQKIVSTSLNNTCTESFSGTSAAAPLAAGVVALALQANPSLTWRDVQHLLVLSSSYDTLSKNKGWHRNALGLYFNLRFGFGLIDAGKMVQMARTWQTVPEKAICEFEAVRGGNHTFASGAGTTLLFEVSGCPEWGVGISGVQKVEGLYLEHVEAVLSVDHPRRGALQVDLKSARGTLTTLLTKRKNDKSYDGYDKWPFMSVHTWGEDPRGTWYLTVTDTTRTKGGSGGRAGVVTAALLRVHVSLGVPKGAAPRRYRAQYDFHKTH